MAVSEVQVEAAIEEIAKRTPLPSAVLGLIRRQPLGAAGAFIVIIMILMAALANFIAPFDPIVE